MAADPTPTPSSTTAHSGGLFGSAPRSTASTAAPADGIPYGSSLFERGTSTAVSSGASLFGQAQPSPAPASSSTYYYRGAAYVLDPSTGPLWGSSNAVSSRPTLFGGARPNAASSAAATPAPSLFANTAATPAPSLFGASTVATRGSSLFGGAQADAAPASSAVVPASGGAMLSLTSCLPILAASNDSASWKPTTTSKYDADDMITLLVGVEEQPMLAHGSFLALRSKFFKAALKKEWIEGQTRTVKLPEEKQEVIAQYLDVVYGKGLPTDADKDNLHKGHVYVTLTELFGLGERLLNATLRNSILVEIIRFTTIHAPEGHYYPGTHAINNVYTCTTAGSPARRLMVDLYAAAGKQDWFTNDMHPAFLLDSGKVLMSQVQGSTLACRLRKPKASDYVEVG